MMRKLFVLFLFVSVAISAQTSDELFANANILYKDGKYGEAIKLYEEIEANNEVSSELYYNLGNCYYKLNKVAETIYNYEKALMLNPGNSDAQNNLIFANRLTLDRIESLPKSVFQRFDENVLQKLSYNGWAVVTVIFSILGATLFLLFYFSDISSRKRLFFVASMASFLLLILSLVISYQQYNQSKNTVEAIIFTEEVPIQTEPTQNADTAFTLHEGTKVQIIDTVDDWKKIRLSDGKIGWMYAKDLKVLNVF